MKRIAGFAVVALIASTASHGVVFGGDDHGDEDDGAAPRLTVVAEGLAQPRHMDISRRGDLYVAEAGNGGTDQTEGLFFAGAEHCTGFSGAVSRLDRDGELERIVTGLPSTAHCDDESQGLGPSGVLASGRHEVIVQIGSPAIFDPNTPAVTAGGDRFGRVLRARDDGRVRRVIADVTAIEAADDPDGEGYDSNPVDVARRGGGFVVADAGANAVHVLDSRGRRVRTILIPQDPCPGNPGNCFGDPNLDSVPTGIAEGRHDTYYVSTLSGVVADFTVTPPDVGFRPGNGKVFAVDAGTGEVTELATGLTTVIDVAYDRRNDVVYAAEFLTGAVWRIDTDSGERTRVDEPGELVTPGGLAVDRHGDLYVSVFAAAPGNAGQIVKYDL
jgi:hypothetical protein